MSEIAKLYDEVMSGEQIDKTAADANADAGPEFDQAFFEKVATGDEEAMETMNNFIDEARAEGHSDEEIETAIGEAMIASGYEGEDDEAVGEPEDEGDEYETMKMSAYIEGSEQAIKDLLESDMAKEAEITAEDLVEYELGGYYGAGYAETRREGEEALAKIAKAKGRMAEGMGKARKAGARVLELLKGGKKGRKGRPGNVPGSFGRKAKKEQRREALKSLAARGAAGGAALGLGAAGYRAAKGRGEE